jgi:hypothetical protein
MATNIDLTKNSVRKLIQDLLDVVPVPPTTTTAGKARQWFGSQGGLQPTAVKNWMRQSLTQDSLYNGATVTVTGPNAAVYCADIDDKLDEFLAGSAPEDEPDASAHAFLSGNDAYEFDEDFIDWMDANVIVTIIVEI